MKKYVVSVNYGDYNDYSTKPLVVVDTIEKAKEQEESLGKFFKETIVVLREFNKIYNWNSYIIAKKSNSGLSYEDFINGNIRGFVESKCNQYPVDYVMKHFDTIKSVVNFGYNQCQIDEVDYL